MAKAGETITLSLVVSGDNGSKFPRATLEDSGGVPLAASPIDLTHVSNGRYTNVFTMPSNDVYVNYIVYSDAGHTTKDPLFDQDSEVIEFEQVDNKDIYDKVISSAPTDLVGSIDDTTDLVGVVADDSQNIIAEIEG